MLMVVFGAGASYDSSMDYDPSSADPIPTLDEYIHLRTIRPPMASQLFELRKTFAIAAQSLPKCQIPISKLRNLPPDVSIEQKLEKIREEASNYAEGRRELVSIRFYLQWIISECQRQWNDVIKSQTNYRVLLGLIDQQRKGEAVCFVTFNYDTLLEEAFASLGMKFKSLDDYVSSNDYKIIKLHGSVNWVREPTIPIPTNKADHVEVANDVLNTVDKMELSDKYHRVSSIHLLQHKIFSYTTIRDVGPGVVFPAIAIPVEKKIEYECPKEHVKALQECI